jgi:hypothetical protein
VTGLRELTAFGRFFRGDPGPVCALSPAASTTPGVLRNLQNLRSRRGFTGRHDPDSLLEPFSALDLS